MPSQRSKSTKKIHHRPVYQKVILFPFFQILRLWHLTLRVEFEGNGLELLRSTDKPYMLISWHNNLFTVPMFIKRFRRERVVNGLISASKDGAWLVAIFELIGFKCIRGSANYRGAQSLKELIRATRQGQDIGITPDGSKGPAYVLKPGAAAVAKLCKVGIILVGYEYQSAWRLNSWDRFFIPKPFSSIKLRIERIADYASLGADDPYDASLVIQKHLMRLQPEDPLLPDPAKNKTMPTREELSPDLD